MTGYLVPEDGLELSPSLEKRYISILHNLVYRNLNLV
jgi:hypothetical protein